MKVSKANRLSSVFIISLIFLSIAGVARAQLEGSNAAEITFLKRKTPSGEYIDPASFFRFHGYVTLTYARPEEDLTGQILVSDISAVSARNEGGFRNDAALFVGGEPFEGVGSVIELHLVGNALDPVITEAKFIWDLMEETNNVFSLRIIGGRFWWPFGIHNDEWFSAVNRFDLVSPAATQILPPHYNEVGVMTEGELRLGSHFGGNYLVSYGNGVSSFNMMDIVAGPSNSYDYNDDRTWTGRVGLVYSGQGRIELGLSGASGELRSGILLADPADPRNYAADFSAIGIDFRVNGIYGMGLRSYYYSSTEDLDSAPLEELDRQGGTVEPTYTIETGLRFLKHLTFVGRYSLSHTDQLDASEVGLVQYGGGINLGLTRTLLAKLGYLVQKEKKDAVELDNDIFSMSFTAEF